MRCHSSPSRDLLHTGWCWYVVLVVMAIRSSHTSSQVVKKII